MNWSAALIVKVFEEMSAMNPWETADSEADEPGPVHASFVAAKVLLPCFSTAPAAVPHFLYFSLTTTRTPSWMPLQSFSCTATTSLVCHTTDLLQALVLTNPFLPQVIAIISNAIICSAAAWNLPISQNVDLYSKIANVPDNAEFPAHSKSQLSRILMST